MSIEDFKRGSLSMPKESHSELPFSGDDPLMDVALRELQRGATTEHVDHTFVPLKKRSAVDRIALASLNIPEATEEFSVKFDGYLQFMEREHFFTGTVIVTRGAQILFCKGYGNERDNSAAIFPIASLTKSITATAIMRLCEEHGIPIETPINQLLPEKYQSPLWKEVTLHHLLSNTSGIPSYTSRKDYIDVCLRLTVEDILTEAKQLSLLFAPGSEYNYSGTGYILLGKIIEHISGTSYAQFIHEKILEPAEMMSSGLDASALSSKISSGHGLDQVGTALIEKNIDESTLAFSGGGLFSTVQDLAKWSRALDGHPPILTPASLKQMTTPVIGPYGYGLVIGKAFGSKTIEYNGGITGFRTKFCKYPDHELFIAILCDNEDVDTQRISRDLAKILLKPTDALSKLTPFPENFDFSFYTTIFQSTKCSEVTFSFLKEGESLTVVMPGNPPQKCMYLSNGRLFFPQEELEFERRGDQLLVYRSTETEVFDVLNREVD